MSESKKTPFLEEMIAAAKKIGDTKNPPLTAERFFVAMMDDEAVCIMYVLVNLIVKMELVRAWQLHVCELYRQNKLTKLTL